MAATVVLAVLAAGAMALAGWLIAPRAPTPPPAAITLPAEARSPHRSTAVDTGGRVDHAAPPPAPIAPQSDDDDDDDDDD